MAEGRFRSELGSLAVPTAHREPLDTKEYASDRLVGFLRTMLTIRMAEEAIANLVVAGDAKTPCHLGIGQEAVAAGVCAELRPTDRAFGNHRSHSHFLAMGGTPDALIAEVLGKQSGTSRGMGGSMHLFGGDFGFQGSVPLVGATIPIAVGAGLACKMDRRGDVAVAFFGDGATEEGVFHESMNLAVVYDLPVLFVCENNLFSSHLDIHLRQPSDRIARYGEAHKVASLTVDGNDVLAVQRAAAELIGRARAGGGPGFLEAVTYRFRGHVGPNEDIDVGVRRRVEELAEWKERCPVQRLSRALLAQGILSEQTLAALSREIRATVQDAVTRAKAAPYPDPDALLDLVYAGNAGGHRQ